MEKEILIENLKTKLGEDTASVISAKTLDGIASVLLTQFSDDNAITDDTWTLPIAVLKEYAGQKRHDDKVFAEKYKKDYGAEHEKDVLGRINKAKEEAVEEYKKGLEKEQERPDREGETDIEDRINKAMEVAVQKLTSDDGVIGSKLKEISRFAENFKEKERVTVEKNIRKELSDYLKSRKADKEAVIDLTVEQIKIGETPNIAELKVLAEQKYESNYKRFYGDGGQPFGGNGSGGAGRGSSFVRERLGRLEAEAKESLDYSSDLTKTFV